MLGTVIYERLDGYKILIASVKFLNTSENETFFIRNNIFLYNFEYICCIHDVYQSLGKARILYFKNKECSVFCDRVASNSSF
jgi:hypothetical protein